MREALQFSESLTEMNSHHLDCTITGGEGEAWGGEGRRGEGGEQKAVRAFSAVKNPGSGTHSVLSLSAS